MGVKTFFHELKAKSPPKRLFRALVTESHDVVPKAHNHFKSIEVVEGHGVAPGSVLKTNFHEGSPFKYIKNRVDEIDTQNYVGKFTSFEGDALGHKVEKIHYEMKFEAAPDGGTVIKLKNEYHTKGDAELTEEEVNASKDFAFELFKACDDHLTANPHVCA